MSLLTGSSSRMGEVLDVHATGPLVRSRRTGGGRCRFGGGTGGLRLDHPHGDSGEPRFGHRTLDRLGPCVRGAVAGGGAPGHGCGTSLGSAGPDRCGA